MLTVLTWRLAGPFRFGENWRWMHDRKSLKSTYDAVVVGAGHNGLISAAYLQKSGLNVCVLERRHLIGGASVTEELVPGFKFSRASYLLSLLRPQICKDLELKKYGLKVFLRDPSSYTPLIKPVGRNGKARSLLLGRDVQKNAQQISQFSEKDANLFLEYEKQLFRIVSGIGPLLDNAPVHLPDLIKGGISKRLQLLPAIRAFLSSVKSIGNDTEAFLELLTAPATKILDKWFESELLKATLATDAIIGSMSSPRSPGSAYVLLHHMMGELEDTKGAWGYVEGGMGSVSKAIAMCAVHHGAHIFTDEPVSKFLVSPTGQAVGVVLKNGTEIKAMAVLSNATPNITFLDLLPQELLPEEIRREIEQIDYTSPVTKINVAVSKLPDFTADPSVRGNKPMPHHQCTIHLNCETMDDIHNAFLDAQLGQPSRRPVIEMVIPSSVDPTIAPSGSHVVLLFTQYTPYNLSEQQTWDENTKNTYADRVFDDIEKYAPGFMGSVIARDILSPPDLDKIFGLTGGNIFHGTMSLDQLYFGRPISSFANYRTHIRGLYLCGSGSHPGGGVMGSPGRLAAQAVLTDYSRLK